MNSMWGCVAAVFFVIVSSSANAASGSVDVYSNICVNKETGDVLGTRIIIMHLGGDDVYALYSVAEGSDANPTATWLKPENLAWFRKGRLEFDTKSDDRDVTIRGTVSKNSIVLIAGGFSAKGRPARKQEPIVLKRVILPERFPKCR